MATSIRARRACAHRLGVARGEVDGVGVVERRPTAAGRRRAGRAAAPSTVIVRSPALVEVDEGAPLGLRPERRPRRRTPSSASSAWARWPSSSSPKRGEQRGAARRASPAARPRPPAAARLLEDAAGVDDLARLAAQRHLGELAPLHVPHDRRRRMRRGSLSSPARRASVPPAQWQDPAARSGATPLVPLVRDRAAHEPLVGSRRPARERHRLARGGGLRRVRLRRAQRGAEAAGSRHGSGRSCEPWRRTRAARRATASWPLERLRGRLESALAVQRPRRATKPTAGSRRRRAESKRRRGEVKRLRRRPEL